jgi:hypothetical protein
MPANHRGRLFYMFFLLNWSAEGDCGSEDTPGDPFTALPRQHKRPTYPDLRNVEGMPSLEGTFVSLTHDRQNVPFERVRAIRVMKESMEVLSCLPVIIIVFVARVDAPISASLP